MEKSKIDLAPIALFAYNRPRHTRLALEGLKKNTHAANSLLYIFIDGPKENASVDQVRLIEEVREVVRFDKWCGEVVIAESPVNLGLAESLVRGVTEVVQKHGKLIVLEDDLVSDVYFLSFMNEALNLYEQDNEVACVSGYIYPVKSKLPASFFIKGADCWGWATWKNSWSIYNNDGKFLLQQLKEQGREYEFDFDGSYPYVKMLKDQVEGKNNSWAVRWYASAFLQNKLCLYPGHSLIRNIGNDGSGTHSGITDKFDNALLNEPVYTEKVKTVPDEQSRNAIINYFNEIGQIKNRKTSGLLSRVYERTVPYRVRAWINKKRNTEQPKKSPWSGDYLSWQQVSSECTGYDHEVIFDKVKRATLQVKKGEAVFERDSVLFYEPDFNTGFLETIDTIAKENSDEINIIDFGGALGSVYFQYKSKLKNYKKVNWCVVEQAHFVKFGKQELEDENLKFYYTIEECLKNNTINAILLSSVISYIEKPYELLQQVLNFKLEYIIIDRNLFIDHPKDVLTRQIVPESIYKASYPCWILNKEKLIAFVTRSYKLIKEFDPYNNETIKVDSKKAFFRALVFKKN